MDEWYFSTPSGEMTGPLPKKELLQQIRSGRLDREGMVCPANGSTWVSISDEPEFSRALRRAPTVVGLSVPKQPKGGADDAPARGPSPVPAPAEAPPAATRKTAATAEPAQRPPQGPGGLLTPGTPASSTAQSALPAMPKPPLPTKPKPTAPREPEAKPAAPPVDPKPAAQPARAAAVTAPQEPEAELDPVDVLLAVEPPASSPPAAPAPASPPLAAPAPESSPPAALAPAASMPASPAPAAAAPSAPVPAPVTSSLPDDVDVQQMRGGSGVHGFIRALGLAVAIVGSLLLVLGGSEAAYRAGLATALIGIALVAFARRG